jgi:hypothetical protein
MTEIDPASLAAIIGAAATVTIAMLRVGSKIERVDQRLGRLETELAESKAARVHDRVIVLEQQVQDVKSRVMSRPKEVN